MPFHRLQPLQWMVRHRNDILQAREILASGGSLQEGSFDQFRKLRAHVPRGCGPTCSSSNEMLGFCNAICCMYVAASLQFRS